ncbi:hypothetical protein BKK81_18730 [Cupriavidus sp. USMAHM13]|nr:hypothetical protein BKK81_18730 [Cupriavidus sp. USMAHM13]
MAAAILGECFGSPCWHAAFADFVVQAKGSCMAVSGPRVLEIATGEKVIRQMSQAHGEAIEAFRLQTI